MEWIVLPAPVPGAVEFTIGSAPALAAMLLTAVAPALLVVLDLLRGGRQIPEVPQLRVIDGGKELGRRAA